jgi:hypothetical protein
MSDPVHPDVDPDPSSDVPASGPNLPLFYSLIVLALVAAITIWPS